MEGITSSSNDSKRSPHTDVTDQRPSQNENRLDASYELIDDSTLREFDRQAFTNVGVSLSRAASETVDQIDDQGAALMPEGQVDEHVEGRATPRTSIVGVDVTDVAPDQQGKEMGIHFRALPLDLKNLKVVVVVFFAMALCLAMLNLPSGKQPSEVLVLQAKYQEERATNILLTEKLAVMEAALKNLQDEMRHIKQGARKATSMETPLPPSPKPSGSEPLFSSSSPSSATDSCDWTLLDNCVLRVKAGPCATESVHAVREGLEDGIEVVRGLISQSEPVLRTVVDSVRHATEGVARTVFGREDEKQRSEGEADGDTCGADPVGDLYAGIDSIFQGLAAIVKAGK